MFNIVFAKRRSTFRVGLGAIS